MNEEFGNRKFAFDFQGKKIIFEIDQLASQSEKSILCRYGNTVVLTVLCFEQLTEENDLKFVPLTVLFEEKFYSVGKIPAVFNKREGKPDYNSVTIARLIDRSIRSFFNLEDKQKIQITSSVLAFDPADDPRIVACWNSILACYLSPHLVSFDQLAATVVVGKNEQGFICNPTVKQMEQSTLELIITVTEKEKIVMLELGAEEISENELEKAVFFAQAKIQEIISFFRQIAIALNVCKKPRFLPEKEMDQAWAARIKNHLTSILIAHDSWSIKKKKLRECLVALKREVEQSDQQSAKINVDLLWDLTFQKWMEENFHQTKQRIDGRKKEEIRPLKIQVNYLPNVHGSALFERGREGQTTQVLSVITLAKASERQLVDNIFVNSHKHFIHHYNFPSFAVNEISGNFRSTSRREIGHGQLVEKTFPSLLPTTDDFPYTIRVVSEVLSSDGSSSQASICATSLALISSGIPLKKPVAGIALGLLAGEILVDIIGIEDKFGKMDFKIAGTDKGICSSQLDVKNEGITFLTFQESLKQGKKARFHLLEEMNKHLFRINPSLSPQVIKFKKILIGAESFGIIVGAKGKTINYLIQEFGVSIDLQPTNGCLLIYHQEEKQIKKAWEFIQSLIRKSKL